MTKVKIQQQPLWTTDRIAEAVLFIVTQTAVQLAAASSISWDEVVRAGLTAVAYLGTRGGFLYRKRGR